MELGHAVRAELNVHNHPLETSGVLIATGMLEGGGGGREGGEREGERDFYIGSQKSTIVL